MMAQSITELGAVLGEGGVCQFCVWAPKVEHLVLHIIAPQEQELSMQRDQDGYFRAAVPNLEPGALYKYRLAPDKERPDPASRTQPEGVHGPSQVVSSDFEWTDAGWFGQPLEDYIFYELHIGTFTPEGTFEAAIPHLDRLQALGITAVEIMPVAQFPGARGWGYDGVNIYAPHVAYGGAQGLKRLVDACHQRGLAVVLDVVYNHLGPEGNYLNDYGPYFTEYYHTPWGMALNFDSAESDHVRRYFIDNALYWITEFHIDALRLDATHAMLDFSARTFLEELVERVHAQALRLNRQVFLIAESDRADDRMLRPVEQGGYAMDAQWSDDLHHVLHTLLTREEFGYYMDFGLFPQLTAALRHGFVYSGTYSPFHKRRHGSFRSDLPAKRFVVCSQNHDQVGNRMNGDRLTQLVTFEELKLAAGVVLLSPYLPLLFMGEEYGETAPFLFFTSFEDPELSQAVTEGRRNEFKDHQWEGEAPDPQAEDTFMRAKLQQRLWQVGHHQVLHDFYTQLIALRKSVPALRHLDKDRMNVIGFDREQVLFMHRWYDRSEVVCMFNFNEQVVTLTLPMPHGHWQVALHSADARWQPAPVEIETVLTPDWDETSSAELTLNPKAMVVFIKAPLD
ncbi:MAG: malto-oligosyltrehalose trehalohydrolase [Anaerolineae bacterium]